MPLKNTKNKEIYKVYVGSTINSLKVRLAQHQYNSKKRAKQGSDNPNGHLIDFLQQSPKCTPLWNKSKIIDSDVSQYKTRLKESIF